MVARLTSTGGLHSLCALALAGAGAAAHAVEDGVQTFTSPPVYASELVSAPVLTASGASVAAADTALANPSPARWSASGETLVGGYRWSLSRGAVDVGLRFQSAPLWLRPHELRAEAGGPLVATLPAVSLGLRQEGPGTPAGSLLQRSYGAAENYLSKVGIEWKPAESRVNFLREGLGIRLDGNDRMTVRLRKGVIGVYMHRKF